MASKITNVERFLVQVPFVERTRLDMERAEIFEWSELEIFRVETDTGHIGWGETVQKYTWSTVKETDQVIGKSPFDVMWDDANGAGLQMALFDAAGKTAGVPLYRLLDRKCRDWCAISYWHHDTTPERYAEEAQVAVELGYTCMKIKARPWFDVRETMRQISDVTPDHFRIDADWNAFLNNAGVAVPVLKELEAAFPKIKMWEDPIGRGDAVGNRHLRTQINCPIAHHYIDEGIDARTGIELGGVCDGWILNGGVSRTMREGHTCASLNMPFFLQLVGTGLTTTLSLHLSAALTHAQWPTITCHDLYEHNLLTERIPVLDGHARVPEAPGLGIEIDETALAKYRVEKADHTLPKRLTKTTRPGNAAIYFANTVQMWDFYSLGNQPVDEWGCNTELLKDDGSVEFAKLHEEATESPAIRPK
jgi:L-alanine-DL-glutamate epimerase-like enolase superfamily enzyme